MHQFQLDQVFQNLIGNAIRYQKRASRRNPFRGPPAGEGLALFRPDNGIGIDTQYKEQVFEIFKRLHSVAEYPGTGMGLAICKRIVERAGEPSGWNPHLGGVDVFLYSPAPRSLAGRLRKSRFVLFLSRIIPRMRDWSAERSKSTGRRRADLITDGETL